MSRYTSAKQSVLGLCSTYYGMWEGTFPTRYCLCGLALDLKGNVEEVRAGPDPLFHSYLLIKVIVWQGLTQWKFALGGLDSERFWGMFYSTRFLSSSEHSGYCLIVFLVCKLWDPWINLYHLLLAEASRFNFWVLWTMCRLGFQFRYVWLGWTANWCFNILILYLILILSPFLKTSVYVDSFPPHPIPSVKSYSFLVFQIFLYSFAAMALTPISCALLMSLTPFS